MRTAKRRPDARVRYAEAHPAITIHLPDRETRAKIDELSERSGLSKGQLVKQALGVAEHDFDAEYEAAYSRGYADGSRAGRAEWQAVLPKWQAALEASRNRVRELETTVRAMRAT